MTYDGIIAVFCGNAIALVAFLISPVRARLALDRLERRPALCAITGVLGWGASIPLAVALLCTIVLAPLVLLEGIAAAAGVFVGTSASALLLGRRLYETLDPKGTTSEATALILGLVLLSAAELVPVLGHVVSAAVCVVALGASILACLPDRKLGPRPPPQPAAPIGGPPMLP